MDSNYQNTEERLISPKELALRWDCSRTSAQRIAGRAGIPKIMLGEGRNGMVRYSLTEVMNYEQSRKIEHPYV